MPLRPPAVFTFAAAVFIAALAIFLRLPVCGESLWVDELHSAWASWGNWQEIAGRAERGNQTPWYFYLLWGWRHAFGGSELSLRLPSVLATALAAAVLVVGVARNGGGLLGGIIAGLLMAVDRNAIFFGTEARPYAGVMLAVAVAAWAGVELRSPQNRSRELRSPENRGRGGRGWARAALLLACFVGFLFHATAAIPLAVLATTLWGWPLWRSPRGGCSGSWEKNSFSASQYFAVAAVMLLALWINADVLFRVWSDRSQWNAFGRPGSFRELWTIWPWIWLVLLPVAASITSQLLFSGSSGSGLCSGSGWGSDKSVRGDAAATGTASIAPILAAALLATLVAWAVSCLDIAPIWHRRFLVGVLPLLCWSAGGYWGKSVSRIATRCPWLSPSASSFTAASGKIALAALVAAVAVGGLMSSQGTLAKGLAGNRVWVRRGEDWRGAVAFLQQHRRPDDPVLVGAELLESTALDPQQGEVLKPSAGMPKPSAGMIEYLLYPVSGPYSVEGAVPLGRQPTTVRRQILLAIGDLQQGSAPGTVWVLLRNGPPQMQAILSGGDLGKGDDPDTGESESLAGPFEMRVFGGLTLVQIPVENRD